MGAQLTQVCQPVLLGEIPEVWKPVIALQREVYEAGLKLIKPGVSFGALEDFVSGFGSKSGMRTTLTIAWLWLWRRWAAVHSSNEK